MSKTIDFDGKSLGGGLQLADHLHQFMVNLRMLFYIMQSIKAKHVQVDHLFPPFRFRQKAFTDKFFHFNGGTEVYRIHIYIQRTFDAPCSRLPHTPPILERIADQRIRRDGGDGLIKILHFHGSKRDLYHIPVRTIFTHRNPIARTQHIIGRKLYTCHQPQYTIPENQHQYRGRSS